MNTLLLLELVVPEPPAPPLPASVPASAAGVSTPASQVPPAR
jgi:hypothetical protein